VTPIVPRLRQAWPMALIALLALTVAGFTVRRVVG
jgi:hypothetical protein